MKPTINGYCPYCVAQARAQDTPVSSIKSRLRIDGAMVACDQCGSVMHLSELGRHMAMAIAKTSGQQLRHQIDTGVAGGVYWSFPHGRDGTISVIELIQGMADAIDDLALIANLHVTH